MGERVPVASRAELMAPYERPSAILLRQTWDEQLQLRIGAVAGALFLAFTLVAALAGFGDVAVLSGVLVGAAACVVASWLVPLQLLVWRLQRRWGIETELGTVRAQRPQAGGEDPDVAHPEYAVSVEDGGRLVVWRFRPLLLTERPHEDELEVPGRPRYAAAPVADAPYDLTDTARAGEQLVAAQERAAAWEAANAREGRAALASGLDAEERAIEAASTAEALRHVTGQRRHRR